MSWQQWAGQVLEVGQHGHVPDATSSSVPHTLFLRKLAISRSGNDKALAGRTHGQHASVEKNELVLPKK